MSSFNFIFKWSVLKQLLNICRGSLLLFISVLAFLRERETERERNGGKVNMMYRKIKNNFVLLLNSHTQAGVIFSPLNFLDLNSYSLGSLKNIYTQKEWLIYLVSCFISCQPQKQFSCQEQGGTRAGRYIEFVGYQYILYKWYDIRQYPLYRYTVVWNERIWKFREGHRLSCCSENEWYNLL